MMATRFGPGLCALWLAAWPAAAQEWFTRDACSVAEARLDPRAYPVELRARARAAADRVANGTGRLWEIRSPEGRVSHLWGTYHSADPLILDLPAAFRKVLEDARVVLVEGDPLPGDRAEATEAFDVTWMWKDGTAVAPPSAELPPVPPEVEGWIAARMAAIGWDADYLPMLTDAGILALILSDPCEDFLLGVLPIQDTYIAQLAYLSGAEIVGLEPGSTFGRDLTAPERALDARSAVILYGGALGPDSAAPGLRATLFTLYREGRLAEHGAWFEAVLAEAAGAPMSELLTEATDRYLLTERNHRFVATASPEILDGGAVIAVGAGHLPGETGLVTLLRAEGFAVTRVLLPGEAP
jgi:uncharacterized protein